MVELILWGLLAVQTGLVGYSVWRFRRAEKLIRQLDDHLATEKKTVAAESKANEEACSIIERHEQLVEDLIAAAFPNEPWGDVDAQRLIERVTHLGVHFDRAAQRDRDVAVQKRQRNRQRDKRSRKARKKQRARNAA